MHPEALHVRYQQGGHYEYWAFVLWRQHTAELSLTGIPFNPGSPP